MKFVTLGPHDNDNMELTAKPDFEALDSPRYSVLVPYENADVERTVSLAFLLASHIRLNNRGEVFVDQRLIRRTFRQLRARRVVVEAYNAMPRIPAGERIIPNRRYQLMAPDAREIAQRLLRQIDPVLEALVSQGTAFYFSTTSHTYIWYPSERAIVSLDDDAPHYVCVHSTDHTVEQNTYDWALTMRTFLLGDETHWRTKANFHSEFRLRGGRVAYLATDIPLQKEN